MTPKKKKKSGGQATAAARLREFRERRRRAGLVEVWAPKDMVPEIEEAVEIALLKAAILDERKLVDSDAGNESS